MTDLLKKILEILKENGPLKAKKIALILDPTRTKILRSDVNSELYKANVDGLVKNENDEWSYKNFQVLEISFTCNSSWLSASHIEHALKKYPELLKLSSNVIFDFSNKSLFLDCILKILSITNQLVNAGSKVTLKFDKNSESISYLSRCGFFDKIHEDVEVLPSRPEISLAKLHNANSENLFEIISINANYDEYYLERLDELMAARLSDGDRNFLLNKLSTFIGEIVGNIRDHGLSNIDGYIALQIYNSTKIVIAISDSGAGLITTLRDEALIHYQAIPELRELKDPTLTNDIELLKYVFNKGRISRTGLDERGLGLSRTNNVLKKISNTKVTNINLTIRQQTNEIYFPFGIDGIETLGCKIKQNLMFIEGTHFVLTIQLDKKQ
ncbi:ATP-binding protein [Acinetobacter radioresistens]|uniref:ATP-binding protein n=1 Tax=Acinetobacter radioresistens TaxID=40216 RepID=UPI0020030A6B|nr:ATP-binding protein [Acinetobacter radioresistens]MCK4085510.1 ATP-binding protein [Acinetobacter radioresistens]